MKLSKQLDPTALLFAVRSTAQADSYGPMSQSNEQSPTPPAQQSPQELQQLVAPIALYPDALVAQILAASTYPTQIVEADRWLQSHSDLKVKTGPRSRQTALGSERKGSRTISLGS